MVNPKKTSQRRNNPTKTLTYTKTAAEISAAMAPVFGSQSAVAQHGVVLTTLAYAQAACFEFALSATADFGRDAALAVTPSGVLVGRPKYEGRFIVRDDSGSPAFTEAWNFADGPWRTIGSRGPADWMLRHTQVPVSGESVMSMGPSMDRLEEVARWTIVEHGLQITSGQGLSPTGHLPYLHLKTGTGAVEHLPPLGVWDWLDRVQLADKRGSVLHAVEPVEQ